MPGPNVEEIRTKAFTTSFRGYDKDEVQNFLTETAASVSQVMEELDKKVLSEPVPTPYVADLLGYVSSFIEVALQKHAPAPADSPALIDRIRTSAALVDGSNEAAQAVLEDARNRIRSYLDEAKAYKARQEAAEVKLQQRSSDLDSREAELARLAQQLSEEHAERTQILDTAYNNSQATLNAEHAQRTAAVEAAHAERTRSLDAAHTQRVQEVNEFAAQQDAELVRRTQELDARTTRLDEREQNLETLAVSLSKAQEEIDTLRKTLEEEASLTRDELSAVAATNVARATELEEQAHNLAAFEVRLTTTAGQLTEREDAVVVLERTLATQKALIDESIESAMDQLTAARASFS